MKGPIELNNIAVKNVSSKCTTPSEIEGNSELRIIMYRKCMAKLCYINFLIVSNIGCKFKVH